MRELLPTTRLIWTHTVDQPLLPPEGPMPDVPKVSAISGSSSLVALRGRHLHLAGSYENGGDWVGAYVDDEELQLVRRAANKNMKPAQGDKHA